MRADLALCYRIIFLIGFIFARASYSSIAARVPHSKARIRSENRFTIAALSENLRLAYKTFCGFLP